MAAPKTTERSTQSGEVCGIRPYVPDEARMHEFTWGAVLVGSLLGIVFGASSLYLTLKVGLTVSASIPVAVLSITLSRIASRVFRIRRTTILENNIVQTAGSSGESIAFGVGVTMPALMILGFEMDIGRVMVVAVLGGLLGIMMMIPLRRAFIVKQHGKLKYPEGTACADVLIVGEQGGASAKTVFVGFGLAFVYQFLMQGMKFWKEVPERAIGWYNGAVAAIEVNPALLGVGYIIGTRVSCIMAAGGVLSSFVLIPAIRLFGDNLPAPIYPATAKIHDMSAEEIWKNYILYIGAGAVVAGGIISLVRAMPLIGGSIRSAFRDMRAARGDATAIRRTNRDLPLWLVGIGSICLIAAIWSTTKLHESVSWIPELEVNWAGALMIVLFGFLFVTVSSRLTGEIGSSSNPISGMTVATLLLTCLVFFVWHHAEYAGNPKILSEDLLAAISVAAVVCIAASNGGTTSQDLKTGFLVGATPRLQQWAIVIGTLTSALVIGVILIALNNASTVYTIQHLPVLRQALDVSKLPDVEQPRGVDDKNIYHVWQAIDGNPEGAPQGKYLVDDAGRIRYLVDPGINGTVEFRDDGAKVLKFKAPKAQLMALIASGILRQKLPWALVLLGVSIAIVLELCGVPSLPFAVGVYLPMSTSMPIFAGGVIRFISDRFARSASGAPRTEAESDMSPGVLVSTGYIAGGTIAAVLLAFVSFGDAIPSFLGQWQYRQVPVAEGKPFQAQLDKIASDDLGIPLRSAEKPDADANADTANLSDVEKRRAASKKAEEDKLRAAAISKRVFEIIDLNRGQLAQLAPVRGGMVIRLPANKPYQVPKDETLGDVAKDALKSEGQALLLLDLNESQINPPPILPAGTLLKVPQHTWPALAAFGLLSLVLLAVGLGWLFAGSTGAESPKRPAAAPAPDPNAARKPPGK